MAELNAAARKRIPTSNYAVVQHTDGKVVKKFPINDMAHARNALARAGNRSPQIKAAVAHKVAAKFPALAKRSSVIKGSSKVNSPKGRGY